MVLTRGTRQSNGAADLVQVATTRNNGISWTRHTLPGAPMLARDQNYIPFSAPDPNDLFAWVSPYLYASHDGGSSWSRYDEAALTPAGLGAEFSDIDFPNADYGWYADGPLFEYTTDGGRRWTEFQHAG